MTNIELKSMISEYAAEKVYARNRAEDAYEADNKEDAEIWEAIEVAYSDLIYKLGKFLKK